MLIKCKCLCKEFQALNAELYVCRPDPVTLFYFSSKLPHIFRIDNLYSSQKIIKYYAQSPNVNLVAITLTVKQFRRHKKLRTTESCRSFSIPKLTTKAKVRNLYYEFLFYLDRNSLLLF